MKEKLTPELKRTILFQNDAFEIVSIQWSEECRSALHNHGWSQCHVLIQEGSFQNRMEAGAASETRRLEVGQVLSTPVGASHEMRCLTAEGKTLHVYTPRIKAWESKDQKFRPAIDAACLSELSLGAGVQLERLSEILGMIERNSISTNSPFFMNQLFSGVHPQTLLAEDVIARTKTTLATQEAAPVYSKIESEIVQQLGGLIGWDPLHRDGVSVPGGSAANFMALQLAKHLKFPDSKTHGLAGRPLKIFVSTDAHYSFQKAANAMGFGTDAVVKVGVDEAGRMSPARLSDALLQAVERGDIPLLVSATAGTTVYGAFDPIAALHEVCRHHKVWLHVDGAWGGPVLFSKSARHLVQGIELADSVTFDAHKLFGASLTCSYVLTKHKNLLLEANDVSGAEYLFHENSTEIDRGKLSWQCGRRADSLSFWSVWKSLGTDGLGSFVDRLFAVREASLEWVRLQPRLEVVKEPQFLNLCIRVRPPAGAETAEWSREVRERLKEENLAMINYSSDEKGTFLRLILAHPEINAEYVQQILAAALSVTR